MVNVRMGQQHKVNRAHVKTEIQGPQVFRARFGAALKHAAIDQKTNSVRLHQSARTGHFAGCAKKADSHGQISSRCDKA